MGRLVGFGLACVGAIAAWPYLAQFAQQDREIGQMQAHAAELAAQIAGAETANRELRNRLDAIDAAPYLCPFDLAINATIDVGPATSITLVQVRSGRGGDFCQFQIADGDRTMQPVSLQAGRNTAFAGQTHRLRVVAATAPANGDGQNCRVLISRGGRDFDSAATPEICRQIVRRRPRTEGDER
jgi:hypothetical protein